MTRSLHPHCILTEPVCKTMSGKGREGNRERNGKEVLLNQPIPKRLVSDTPSPEPIGSGRC